MGPDRRRYAEKEYEKDEAIGNETQKKKGDEKMIKGAALLFFAIFAAHLAFAEGDVQDLKDFQYWENGKVRQCTVYDSTTGRLKAKAFCRHNGTTEKVEKYDEYGNKKEEALYDENGKLKAGIDGWAAMRWWYEGSVLISQISYDEYGLPIEWKQYSDSGKLIGRRYLDRDDLNPYEEASMAMLLGPNNMRFYRPDQRMDEADKILR